MRNQNSTGTGTGTGELTPLTPLPEDARPLAERVYACLRTDLMAGRFSSSARLGEEKLARSYGVSRTPIREALSRLSADGLVERETDGLYPYRPRLEELGDLYEVRLLLETYGLRRAMDSGTSHDREVLGPELNRWYQVRANPPEPTASVVESDELFHVTLLEASGNPELVRSLKSVNNRIRPARMFDYYTRERIANTIDEHISIAECALEGEYDKAIDILTVHIETSRNIVMERASNALTWAGLAQSIRP